MTRSFDFRTADHLLGEKTLGIVEKEQTRNVRKRCSWQQVRVMLALHGFCQRLYSWTRARARITRDLGQAPGFTGEDLVGSVFGEHVDSVTTHELNLKHVSFNSTHERR